MFGEDDGLKELTGPIFLRPVPRSTGEGGIE
jgi:hypothetical protein